MANLFLSAFFKKGSLTFSPNKVILKVRFGYCVICKRKTFTSELKFGICFDCWRNINERDSRTLSKYLAIDPLFEVFPKTRRG